MSQLLLAVILGASTIVSFYSPATGPSFNPDKIILYKGVTVLGEGETRGCIGLCMTAVPITSGSPDGSIPPGEFHITLKDSATGTETSGSNKLPTDMTLGEYIQRTGDYNGNGPLEFADTLKHVSAVTGAID